jgi:hypothetical protein
VRFVLSIVVMSYQLDGHNQHLIGEIIADDSPEAKTPKKSRNTKPSDKNKTGDSKKPRSDKSSTGEHAKEKVAKPKTKLEAKQLETAIIEPGELVLQEKIGKGNFGVVWKGKCRGVDVAIKKLHAESFDPNTLEEIKKEVALMTYAVMLLQCFRFSFFFLFVCFSILLSFLFFSCPSHSQASASSEHHPLHGRVPDAWTPGHRDGVHVARRPARHHSRLQQQAQLLPEVPHDARHHRRHDVAAREQSADHSQGLEAEKYAGMWKENLFFLFCFVFVAFFVRSIFILTK